ncbi:MAG TPA: Type 1 glutamine amidotransferase-like domain-containing protein [Candidatus Limnocylindria bacterium]
MTRGPLVLCGSGEFTRAMADVDRGILADIGARRVRVAIVPTAAGLEDTPRSWIEMGAAHFAALGAEVSGVMVLNRGDAEDPRHSASIAGADWIYFSGGKPGYVVETLSGTPFWSAVLARHRAGAVLAGSSAGAMMLGSRTLHFPDGVDAAGIPRRVAVRDALGVLPGIFVAPHFDAVPIARWRGWADIWPAGHRMLGIDEDTAIVERADGWSVVGRGRALVFRSLDDHDVHPTGARFDGMPVVGATRT